MCLVWVESGRKRPAQLNCDPCQLLHELGGDYGGHAVDVAGWVIFDDVGADDRPPYAVQDRQDVAHGEAARLVVGNAGSEGGVERIEVDADV